jgi:hypothetical protein
MLVETRLTVPYKITGANEEEKEEEDVAKQIGELVSLKFVGINEVLKKLYTNAPFSDSATRFGILQVQQELGFLWNLWVNGFDVEFFMGLKDTKNTEAGV